MMGLYSKGTLMPLDGRVNECPVIEVYIIDSEQNRPGGVGQPSVPVVAATLTNAIFAATGERIRSVPVMRS